MTAGSGSGGVKQIIRFTVTGGVSAGVYSLVLYLLINTIETHTAAGAAYVAAMAINYLMQRIWTFRSTRRHREALPRYILTHVGGIVLNSTVLYLFVDLQSLPLVPVQIGAFAAVAGWSYLLQKAWVFQLQVKP